MPCAHLLPSAGTARGRCPFPGAGRPPVGASPGLPYLQFKEKRSLGLTRLIPWNDAAGRTATPLPLGESRESVAEHQGCRWMMLSLAHLCSPGSTPPCRPLHRPAHGNLECPERSSAWRKPGETRGDVGEQGPVGGGRASPAAPPYPGVGPPRSRLYTCRGLSR